MLRRVVLKGFKSIKAMDLELRPLNILIGANGAGKSNLVSFFSLLHELSQERLQSWVAASGGADSLLYLGSKTTPGIDITLQFSWRTNPYAPSSIYEARLAHAAPDRLQFTSERLDTQYDDQPTQTPELRSAGGTWESVVPTTATISHPGNAAANHLRRLLRKCLVYHFHDTSKTARIRLGSLIGDTRWLNPDGSNLAALLYAYQTRYPPIYRRIVSTVRLLLPGFDEFILEPDLASPGRILLFWRQTGSDYVLGPHQLSDGTLRAMCLVTLLTQPEDDLPDTRPEDDLPQLSPLIIVDEPELGLHPYALSLIASLFKKASHHTQVLVSTQSTSFLDHFDPEDIVVVNREGNESVFTRPDPAKLETWLEEYSLGEVWEKNVIGGGPH
jgi:predicted ATPase